ncbi:hypothetical protein LCGC14_2331930 [marine sediment metagenome]|uniref:Uncharacterized protein n=1 Tax=marine sediment metagenome TaxID=412755 RepID=A0A0F9CEL3_9ZZZZ
MGFLLQMLARMAPSLLAGGAGFALSEMVGDVIPGLGPSGQTTRRRRRRMLTARDKEDLAFIDATMGKATASKALQLRIAAIR